MLAVELFFYCFDEFARLTIQIFNDFLLIFIERYVRHRKEAPCVISRDARYEEVHSLSKTDGSVCDAIVNFGGDFWEIVRVENSKDELHSTFIYLEILIDHCSRSEGDHLRLCFEFLHKPLCECFFVIRTYLNLVIDLHFCGAVGKCPTHKPQKSGDQCFTGPVNKAVACDYAAYKASQTRPDDWYGLTKLGDIHCRSVLKILIVKVSTAGSATSSYLKGGVKPAKRKVNKGAMMLGGRSGEVDWERSDENQFYPTPPEAT
ncbi:hypothetical protein [Thalassospira indica]|uniref:hypothetical protein n=1 Tax=Thalassospira indica TaxID=1891279 RepID=UPI000ADDFA3E|nr:hypothetical protein [Thalassospira indica]